MDDSTVDADAILTPVAVEQASGDAHGGAGDSLSRGGSGLAVDAAAEPNRASSSVPTPAEPLEAVERALGATPAPAPSETPAERLEDAITFGDSGRSGQTPPFTRATAVTHAEAIASQVSTKSGTPLGQDQLQRNRTDFLDAWDSRWQYP